MAGDSNSTDSEFSELVMCSGDIGEEMKCPNCGNNYTVYGANGTNTYVCNCCRRERGEDERKELLYSKIRGRKI